MSLLREGNAVKQCSQSRLSPAWAVEMSLQRGDPVGGDGCTAQTRPGWEGWMFSVCAQCHPSPKTRLGEEGCALQGLQRGYHPNLPTPCIFQLFKKSCAQILPFSTPFGLQCYAFKNSCYAKMHHQFVSVTSYSS